MTYPTKNVTNCIFGMLTAIEPTEFRSRNGLGSVMWNCLCTCGNTRLVSVSALLRGETRHCGKKPCSKNFTTLTKYDRVIKRYFLQYRLPAQYRELEFTLDIATFINYIRQPCYYCGSNDNIIQINDGRNIHVKLRANGIDRKDNNIGYTIDNCVACCSVCNYGKRMLNSIEYIAHCKKVAAFNDR